MAKSKTKKLAKTAKNVKSAKKSGASKKGTVVSLNKAKSVPQIKKGPIIVKDTYNRSALVSTLVEHSGVTKKQIVAILDTLREVIVAHLVKKGPGKFKLPGVLMMKIKDKPATKARKGINPFTGEPTTFAAKPARRVVKISALKGLKEEI